jgi:hypothetical protein
MRGLKCKKLQRKSRMSYRHVIVTGPEGSGTNILTDLVAELLSWPRSDPGIREIQRIEELESEKVHHISLPSHRPVIWAELVEAQDSLVLGIVRQRIDAIHSSWSRYKGMPMVAGQGPPSISDFKSNYDTANVIAHLRSSLMFSYQRLCELPDYHIQLLSSRLLVQPWRYEELHTHLDNQNGKWKHNQEFIAAWSSDAQYSTQD